MQAPQLSPDEPFRLLALRNTKLLDTPVEERFERVTRLAQRLLQVPVAAISMVDAERQWFKSTQGMNCTETSRCISFCGHAILQDDIFVIPDARLDVRFSDNPLVLGPPNVVFYAGCPIRAADGCKVAVLCVVDHQPRTLSPDDVLVLHDLAGVAEREITASLQCGVQRELLSEIQAARRQAKVDPLTRIWNRGAVYEVLQLELARAATARGSVAVIMADLDHFKAVNDTHGHAAGDEILRQSAKRFLAALRETDAAGRYGGEEFLIVLGPCATPEEATAVAERLCRKFEAAPFRTDAGEIAVTISVGVAFVAWGAHLDENAIVALADGALYRAKNAGRNRVESVAAASPALPAALAA
ncbi:diguanylate cyclase [soil metagenome]